MQINTLQGFFLLDQRFAVCSCKIELRATKCKNVTKYCLRLTFDFLYEIAKDLQEKDAMIMLGGGVKGNEPLVFQDGGKTYRAFLEGRVKDKSYILLIHLSNLELKGINK